MIGELLKNGIAHYAAHTNLDRSFLGPGRILANILGLQRVDRYTRNPADEMNMVFTGSFCPPRPWDEVLGTLKAATGSKSVRLTGNPVTVGSATIVPGSGGSLIRRISRPFDLIVTGEISYHDALLAEQGGQAVAALGHYYSEKPAMLHLASLIGEKYPQIPVFVAGSEGEPYRSL
jgi:putative NIF3 family GTP cyclohydrolase 1 type 2